MSNLSTGISFVCLFVCCVLTPAACCATVVFSRSVFSASAGRGLTFSGGRWGDIVVEDQSSRKLMLTAMAALGSFGCSTPHFWMNLLTVFSCSISLVSEPCCVDLIFSLL